ncbi:hypothetical protein A8O14_05680 [Polynucleobacter wuianus]|uniref:Lipoprotein n=1 Tax=Polynucleobacter wuianus TaxID=1743168 RepID=A0A191UF10_9BURK|nr:MULTISPECIES: hypothetical protein [Polynucleobacter]ANI99614.1 hypothetical protein A8O14_05680 [Polynucleobacter wuianus]MBU3551744.1 hypothetical protein [Polynucleobacter sp. MWH-Post4-6-1]
MYRFALLLAVSLGLVACANNDKKISSWEVNDVYQSTIATPNSSGGKSYIGPSINTTDESNTYEMFNLRSEQSANGAKTYELQIHLTYYTQMRNYDSASLLNGPVTSFKVISREAGLCESRGCMFKELLSVKLSDEFLKQNMKEGFQLTVSSKAGVSTVVYIPPQYIKGYLKAVDGTAY